MSKPTHTPGPWHANYDKADEAYLVSTVEPVHPIYPEIGQHIASLGAYQPNVAANARLISTAPEGLDLAHEVVREHENLDDRAPTEPECEHCNLGTGPHLRTCAYHQAKALIAKAEGRS